MKRGSVAVSFLLLWGGYTLLFTGYCWVRGYNIGFLSIVSPVNFYSGSWPPGQTIPAGQALPSARANG